MTKRPYKLIFILVLAVITILLTAYSSFSVSRAQWVAPAGEVPCSLSVGVWEQKTFEEYTDDDIKSKLNGKSGLVTSSGQVIEFDENGKCDMTLAPGETFYLVAGDIVISDKSLETLGGRTVHVPEDNSISFSGNTFTAPNGGNFTVQYTKEFFDLFTRVDIEKQPNQN